MIPNAIMGMSVIHDGIFVEECFSDVNLAKNEGAF